MTSTVTWTKIGPGASGSVFNVTGAPPQSWSRPTPTHQGTNVSFMYRLKSDGLYPLTLSSEQPWLIVSDSSFNPTV